VVVFNHRKNTAACVSLSKSTISKTNTRKTRRHCFAPVLGGGGDLVAPEVCVKKFFRKTFSIIPGPEAGGGGFLRKPTPRVNRTFQPFHNTENRSLQAAKNPPEEA